MFRRITRGAGILFLAMLWLPMTVKAEPMNAQVDADKIKAAIAELEKMTQAEMQTTGIPGVAIAVVYQDKPVYLKGFGVREVGKPETVDADTVFQLASVSKPLGSTVIAGLVSDGIVKWDDLVTRYEPAFALHDPYATAHLTLRDTYSHRSGLPDHAGDLLEDMGYDRAQVLERQRFVSLENHFRSHYAYTNFGITAGAVAAANAAGKSWEDVSVERLYKPLGMTHTSSRYDDFIKNPNHAAGHVLVDGKWVFQEQRQPDAQSPAGGASSSARDMAQWLRLHLAQGKLDGKEIISAQALGETYVPHMVSSPLSDPAQQRAGFYGLGWGVNYDELGRVKLSHSGAFSMGAATRVIMLPSEQLGIVILTNAAPIGVPEALAQSFIDLATYGQVQRDWLALYQPGFAAVMAEGHSPTDYSKAPAQVAPALANDAYVGTYQNDFVGAIEIAVQDGKLVMTQGPAKNKFPLAHYDRDLFYYNTAGENAVGLSGVRFSIGADGKASNVWIENLDAYGMGNFARVP
ncbi:MAG: serine hydrolase [Chloroflexi bacterium]|nr:serine hydrolase [Chloroflexota bacterium]